MEAITDPATPAFLREAEASSASPPPVQVPGKGRYSLLQIAWWLLSSGWLLGSEWMRSRYKVKLSIIGDDDKRRKAEVLSLGFKMPSRRSVMIGMSSRLV
ncbi:hypothetical protein Bca4012_002610 [Brassica carinata]